MGLRAFWFAASLLLAGVLLLSACSGDTAAPVEAEATADPGSTAEAPVEDSDGIVFSDPEGTYELVIDPEWDETAGPFTGAEQWFVAPSTDPGANLIIITANEPGTELNEETLDAMAEGVTLVMENSEIVDQAIIVGADGQQLGLVEYTGEGMGVGLHFLAVAAADDNHLVITTLAATPEHFEEVRRSVEPYLLTLNATGTPATPTPTEAAPTPTEAAPTPTEAPPTPTEAPQVESQFIDPFEGDLASGWEWVSGDPAGRNLTDMPGYLAMTPASAGSGPSQQALLRQPLAGDYEIETKVQFDPVANFQTSGLLVVGEGDNELGLGWGYCDVGGPGDPCQGEGIFFSGLVDGAFDDTQRVDVPPGTTAVYLRLLHIGGRYTASFSLDGTSWTEIGSRDRVLVNPRVGLGANGAQSPRAEPTAYSDYFSELSVS